MVINSYNAYKIHNQSDIEEAQRLLYISYINHFGWEVPLDNPSNIKFKKGKDGYLLVDDYDNFSEWFIVEREGTFLGCARLCQEDSDKRLEIERYPNANQVLKSILKNKQRIKMVELNREAILPDHENLELPYLVLLNTIFEYCLINNYLVITTTNIRKWVNIYKKISFENLEQYSFKYFHSDLEPVSVYMAFPNIIEILINHIQICIQKILHNKNRSQNFSAVIA